MDAPQSSTNRRREPPSGTSSRYTYSNSVAVSEYTGTAPLAPLTSGVIVEPCDNVDYLRGLLCLDTLPQAFRDGQWLSSRFEFEPGVKEKTIENRLIKIIAEKGVMELGPAKPKFQCRATQQERGFEGGIMDLVVFDKMLSDQRGIEVSKDQPGRPIALIELKTGELRYEKVLDQVLTYSRTVMGYHAGIKALAILMLSEKGFYFGALHWWNNSKLRFEVCRDLFSFEGEKKDDNFNLLHELIFHPAVTRPRSFQFSPVPWLKHLPERLKNLAEFQLMSAVAIGRSSAVYLVTDDISRTKVAVNQENIPTSPFESRAKISLQRTCIAKFFRSSDNYDRELVILGFLQLKKESFGPRILGTDHFNRCILYERLEVAEQNVFFNEYWRPLDPTHFPTLLKDLKFMHSHGIIHQDIRTANVGFRNGRPVLMDFAFSSATPSSLIHKCPLEGLNVNLEFLLASHEGYRGTRETASDRILEELCAHSQAYIRVDEHDDLCSLLKLYYLTYPGFSQIRGVRDWNQLLMLWKFITHIEDLAKLNVAQLREKLEYMFESRSQYYSCLSISRKRNSKRGKKPDVPRDPASSSSSEEEDQEYPITPVSKRFLAEIASEIRSSSI